jgi:hypothetical protein
VIGGKGGDECLASADGVDSNDVVRTGVGNDHVYADPGDRVAPPAESTGLCSAPAS